MEINKSLKMLKWSFALIQSIVIVEKESCIVIATLKMANCCESTNEPVPYNKNGVSVPLNQTLNCTSIVSDFIYRNLFKCYLPFINRLCQTYDFNHVALKPFRILKYLISR